MPKHFSDVTNPASILKAIDEFDRIGREKFLSKYGYRKGRAYYLAHNGQLYDSKAIMGAAFGYEFPSLGALNSQDFSGGEATVKKQLESLGFEVRVLADDGEQAASASLIQGKTYSRENLKEQFGITDATIKNGVFQPKGYSSVWLFVTEEKDKGRTAYKDYLEGDVLHWDGQSKGRTDKLIIEHEQRGLELLLFYRRSKREFEDFAFRYEGKFRYISHQGTQPAHFTLWRIAGGNNELEEQAAQEDQKGAFDPTGSMDARHRVLRAIAHRQGQPAFRRRLLQNYQGKCAITGCNLPQVLEAAHIYPYQGEPTNHPSNGILLRADLHTLFDLYFITIDDETLKVIISPALQGTEYEILHNKKIAVPSEEKYQPSKKALKLHKEKLRLT
jgi:putative restriction endonuclease